MMKALKIPQKYLILISFAGFVVCLDQLTKLYVHTQFSYGESIVVIRDFFNLTYVRNTGAAFGILRDAHESFRSLFFLSVPFIAMLMILFILRGLTDKDKDQIFALSAVFGGALGNYIDRIRYGYVIDFLDFHFYYNLPVVGKGIYTWPAFNVADIAIVCGVGVLLVIMFLQARLEKRQKKAAH